MAVAKGAEAPSHDGRAATLCHRSPPLFFFLASGPCCAVRQTCAYSARGVH